jgi:RHS repeat-associated protein
MMIDVAGGVETRYYYHFDGLGSVVALSDVNSVIVERYSYDVFGDSTIRDANGEIRDTSQVGNPYLFTGRHYDSEVGLYYYRARYYSPYLGRFLQTDPIRYRAGLNLYTYCGNNPLNWVDPLGLWTSRGHEDLTRRAMVLLGFSEWDINKVAWANIDVDRVGNWGNNPEHYMYRSEHEAEEFIAHCLDMAAKCEKSGWHDVAMSYLGQGLHTTQDRYAHSVQGVQNIWQHWLKDADNSDKHSKEFNDAEEASKAYLEKYLSLLGQE